MVFHRLCSTLFDDLLLALVEAWEEMLFPQRLLSKVCGDLFAIFEDSFSEMGASVLARVLELWSVNM